MKRELDIRSERGFSVNGKIAYRMLLARLRALFGAGVSLGFVLFVAITSAAMMSRGSDFAWASLQQMLDEEKPKQAREILLPELPSTRKAQPFRPKVLVQQHQLAVQKPVNNYRTAQERRLLLSDLWSRFNQTLNTVRSFSR